MGSGSLVQRNIALYPYFRAAQSLLFWQAAWFLYFQEVLSVSEAIVLAAVYDVATVLLEVPSGYFSDKLGRRITLIVATLASATGCLLLWNGTSFEVFATGQVLLGMGMAFTSGTDNALLYDSLRVANRQHEVAERELQAWRYGFGGLAVSAALGGIISMASVSYAFLASAIAGFAACAIVLMFHEPPRSPGEEQALAPIEQGRLVVSRIKEPMLLWTFILAVGMYVLSHVPFVFGQPFMEQALATIGFAAETPVVSGFIVSAMMLVSVVAGWGVLPLRRRIGTLACFVTALVMQTALIFVLAASVHPFVIALLGLRMVPDAIARPFILEVVQPRIDSHYRATYLSVQSLAGRIVLAVALFVTAFAVQETEAGAMLPLDVILPWYGVAGGVLIVFVLVKSRWLKS